MKLHTDTQYNPAMFLRLAQDKGLIASDVHFVKYETQGSRTRRFGHEIQLGTYDSTSGPTKSRHYKNSGNSGASGIYAATYDEWGWFLAEIFNADPDAVFGPYKGSADFHEQTKHGFTDPA